MRVLQVALVAMTVFGVAAPAFADRDDWRDHERHERREHEWREHLWRLHEWREHHRDAYVPGYVYAPVPAYPPPAPIYAEPSVQLTIPLQLR